MVTELEVGTFGRGLIYIFLSSFGFLQAGRIDAESGSSSWRRV